MKKLPLLLLWIIIYNAACNKHAGVTDMPTIADTYGNATVLLWNNAATVAVQRSGGVSPMVESRIYAMVHIAMHDALNAIVKKYNPLAMQAAEPTAMPDVAVSQAAHDVIVSCLPAQKLYADSLLDATLGTTSASMEKTKGLELGKASAITIVSQRANDGSALAQYPILQGTSPGIYQSTPPFTATGFAMFPGWGKVAPFGLKNPSQFRPPAPYLVSSPQYTADYNEIKTMGAATGSNRTEEQTQIGIFWLENVPLSWNRIARSLIIKEGLSGWKTTRLLAMLHMAQADANIAAFDAKYFYNFWRPITAVRLGDSDGNPDTGGDGAWNILAPPTPPVPDYPSNHATDGGAAAQLLRRYFGRDDISFSTTSNSLAGVTRNFSSLSQAATEVSLSRIYVGYHFRNAVVAGETMGRKIGDYIFETTLAEVK